MNFLLASTSLDNMVQEDDDDDDVDDSYHY